MKISAVVNTYNEEKNIERCLNSIKDFADEIIVVDMHSSDKTVEITKEYGAKIFQHEYTRYVEPARNFALKQARGDWVLLIDADEELPESLALRLKEDLGKDKADYIEIPRKNIIFGKWIRHARWWPDYLIRFFRAGTVKFSDQIHAPPETRGEGIKLEPKEEYALIHYNFQTISQYVERLNRYSDIQSDELSAKNSLFKISDLVSKPSGEFFSRFFSGEGYKDGVHGLTLSILQAFSEFIVYLKLWEKQGFKEVGVEGLRKTVRQTFKDAFYWQDKTTSNILDKIIFKIKSKI